MLRVTVWGLNPKQAQRSFRKLHTAIVQAVTAIPEMDINDETDMMCFFPSDLMTYGIGKDLIVDVLDNPAADHRTQEVSDRLQTSLVETVSKLYPKAYVEVNVEFVA